MSTIIGVGMQMTASASGMTKGLSEADRSLQLLQKIVDQNQKSLRQFGTEATKTTSSLDKLTSGVRLLAAVEVGRVLVDTFQSLTGVFTSAARQVLSLAANVSQSLDALNDLSARTGIGVEALQGYSLAAKMAGVDVAEFGTAIQRLGVNIGKADPGGTFEKSLQGIGLTLTELRSLNPEAQFAAIGEAISQLPTAADRAAAAVEIFGRQGAALAPLFRDGAASIDELRERAQRLGIIVSEDQINNIANMNDAFDLVRATIDGIIGQVVGNLAPAVTQVLEELLQFVETYEDAAGNTGGTAFANAITDAFIAGARLFVGVLERFAEVAKEVAAALGVDSRTDAERRLAQLEAQVAAGLAPTVAVPGGGGFVNQIDPKFVEELRSLREQVEKEAQASVFAATQDWIDKFEAEVNRSRLPEVKLATNIDETRERFQKFFADTGEVSEELATKFRAFALQLEIAKSSGELTAEEMQLIQSTLTDINTLMDRELDTRRRTREETEAQAEADDKRVAALLNTDDAARRVADDLEALERKRQRVAASQDADTEERLRELDELRSVLQEQQRALRQGFGESFTDEFKTSREVVAEATRKAAEFGEVGAQAAADLASKVSEAQKAVLGGWYSKEDFDNDIKQASELFNVQLQNQKKLADERLKINEFVDQQLALQAFGGDSGRLEASRRVLEIEAEIARVEAEQRAARQAGDDQAARAAATRLAQLDQVAAKERDIATGAVQAREEAEKRLQEQQDAYAKSQEEQQKQIQQAQQAFQQELARRQQAEYERQVARITELNTLGQRQVQTADIRTQEGAALVLELAANAQDPRLIQASLQTKYLRGIYEQALAQAADIQSRAQTVAILGSGF